MATEAREASTLTAEQIVADSKRYTLYDWQAQSKASPLAIDHAEGVYMYGVDGRRWLDFSSQLMGVNIGHGDKRVTDAIAEGSGSSACSAIAASAAPWMKWQTG